MYSRLYSFRIVPNSSPGFLSVMLKTYLEKFSEMKFTMTRLYLDCTLVNWLYC